MWCRHTVAAWSGASGSSRDKGFPGVCQLPGGAARVCELPAEPSAPAAWERLVTRAEPRALGQARGQVTAPCWGRCPFLRPGHNLQLPPELPALNVLFSSAPG